MRIISKYKDYYDGVQAFGMDSSLVYERLVKIVGIEKLDNYKIYLKGISDSYLSMEYIEFLDEKMKDYKIRIELIQIGFCGKMYPCISFLHLKKDVEVKRVSTYSTESTMEYFQKLIDKYGKIEFVEEFYQGCDPNFDDLNKYFKHEVYAKNYASWFQVLNTPIFKFTSNPNIRYDLRYKRLLNDDNLIYVEKNFQLKTYDFFKAFDSYAAFQELSQFLGGILTKRESIPDNLSDMDKVKQHGFDPKYGFRKRPKK